MTSIIISLLLLGFVATCTAFLQTVASVSLRRVDPPIDTFKYQHHSHLCLYAVQDNRFDKILSKLTGVDNIKNTTDSSVRDTSAPTVVSYVIQKIGRGNKKEIDELTRLCIDVFFNKETRNRIPTITGKTGQGVTPWKALQLAYLRNSQAGDIFARNAFKKDQMVEIIVARRVYRASDVEGGKKITYVKQNQQIYNNDELFATDDMQTKFVLGEIIGYCEVIEKNFGLGEKLSSGKPLPYLANLSVSKYARQSGVGSKLLDTSEEIVRDWDSGHTTMVLQVEEDNKDAIRFYKKRGWEFVYADPTCRRFDTSGFFLKESRITKYAMVKKLETTEDSKENESEREKVSKSSAQKLKQLWFVSQ